MWSVAYGLIALALASFVVMYAALHTPSFASVNIADQLYGAKRALYAGKPWLVTDNLTAFNEGVNAAYVVKTYKPAVDSQLGVVYFPLYLPYAYKGEKAERNLKYAVYLGLRECRPAASSSGEPRVLYVVDVALPQLMPWLEVYALVPRNLTEMLQYYYGLYKALGKPPVILLDDPYYGRRYEGLPEFYYVELAKAEWALVRRPDGAYTLYVSAPVEAVGIYVVDYPLALPLSCWDEERARSEPAPNEAPSPPQPPPPG
ncbi:hypothetical protein Pogu_0610 [Pyrobaculum oguniense TE7]|uniref:Uncharacterized protein n=1 Tax=Pyrobaculum oguniense (strain DSM 13380 / JCM 10595 / TE7) TaxID=698757 RepID=H6Q7Y0_PYROT|nr:hypothetical protein Pogu_0610 [Pyrobaculum oguniense TE7]